ncbi:methyltransferase [Geodermatophilus sp. SYSU D01176]
MTAAARAGAGTAPADDGSPQASAGAVIARLLEAFATVEVVRAAERTGVAAFLARTGAASAEEVSTACGLAPEPTGRLLTALAELGVLAPVPPDRFRPVADVARWPTAMAAPWASLEVCLRTGRPMVSADTAAGAAELYPAVVPRLADVFSTAAASAARLLAPSAGRVLDVGAGAAPWSTALAAAAPGVRVTCLDLPQVLAQTRRSVAAAGLSGRFDYLPGDVFTATLPESVYDLVLVGNVCHLFDPATNETLLRRLRPVLTPGGTLAVIDVLPSADPAARARLALYELGLLLRTERGRVYSTEDYSAWTQAAGFGELSTRPLDGPVDLCLLTARIPDGRAGRCGPRTPVGGG